MPIEGWVAAARTPEGALTNPAHWAGAFAALGLGPGTVAGIHDDGRMTEAARVWFILQYFGLPAVILNGGLPAVREAGLAAVPAASAPPVLRPGSGPIGLMERTALRGALERESILDTRTEAEHRGRDLKSNARGGHLPGALLLPHAEFLDGPRLRPAEDLRARLTQAGFAPGRPLTTHCDGGGRAALAAVAALQAGFTPVSVYYLSFSDWAADETCPIVAPQV